MIVDELIAILGFDLRGESDIARFNRGIDQAERNARQAASAFSAMGVAVGTFVGNIATQAFTRLGSAVGSLPGQVLEVGRTFENYRLQLETLEGGSAKAEEAMNWIRQFAKDTPLELADVIDSYASLKNFGIDPTNGSLMALVDAMAASGKGKEQLAGISLALGQAWAKEKLQGEEILQLVERGIPVWDLLSKATGKSSKELQELSSKGKLGRETISKLIDEIGTKYAGASEKFAKSFDGITSKLADEWTDFLAGVSERGFYDDIKRRLEDVFDTITQFRKDGTLDWLEEGFSNFLTGSMRATEHVARQVWNMGRGLYYAADAAAGLVSRVTGLEKGTSAGLLGVGALATTAGGRRLLMGIARKVPFVAALLALDDIVTGLNGGDSYIGSLEGGQQAIDSLREKLGGLREALEALSERLNLGLDWSAVTAPGDFINEELVRFVRDTANEIDRLARSINEFSEGNIWGGLKEALGFKIVKGGLVDRIFGSDENAGHPYTRPYTQVDDDGGRAASLDAFLNFKGNMDRIGGSGSQPVIEDNKQDNRDMSVSVVVNQTVTQATAAAGAAAQATANAVLGAASQANVTRDASEGAF